MHGNPTTCLFEDTLKSIFAALLDQDHVATVKLAEKLPCRYAVLSQICRHATGRSYGAEVRRNKQAPRKNSFHGITRHV